MMGTIILIIIIAVIWGINKARIEARLDNYDISKIDNTKLTKDMINGVSVAERRRRCVNGYYDKK